MNRKITAFTLCAMLSTPCSFANAQQTGKVPRIGFLDSSTASSSTLLVEAFRQELSKLGWIEGKNITIEYRFAEQKPERMSDLAAELVRLKVDLIVVSGIGVALAAKKATATIPIVMTRAGDPVALGLVASLARPGGNITGVSTLSFDLITKRLEVLKDAVPKLARVGVLWQGGAVAGSDSAVLKELRPAAVALKLKLDEIETKLDPKGLERAFQTAKQKQGGRNYDDRWSVLSLGKEAALRVGRQTSVAGNLLTEGVCGSRRSHVLWDGLRGPLPARGCLCGQDLERCQTG
jgi:putative tryptophan/tyrosine transport system substrate-binding protein